MTYYKVTYWQHGERYMIIRCLKAERIMPIFRSIVPDAEIITMEKL